MAIENGPSGNFFPRRPFSLTTQEDCMSVIPVEPFPEQPVPVPPVPDAPPVTEPEPDRLPDEVPNPNPDETDDPPMVL